MWEGWEFDLGTTNQGFRCILHLMHRCLSICGRGRLMGIHVGICRCRRLSAKLLSFPTTLHAEDVAVGLLYCRAAEEVYGD